ncbi:MAG: hypothetical protein KatS3mg102_0463 [Planctomycetota bacterium]|nr:MAG: hypothetical protein KatS3mg102_0463 [Planctomycetota bacterium]
MAWMFAAVQDDMTVGMHLHYHFLYAPPFPPTPFYPHPAIGFLRDKFAAKTKIDNKKAARTGTKSKILLPPHLPYIGPFTHGTPKETTGIQQVWMGAGIGVHPFGGIGFIVIEGKPAAGFLSNMLGCWCVAPGFDMKLPFIGLDFVMMPGFRVPTVFYGPAPLAIDLFVLLLSIIEDLLDYLISKIPIPFLRDLAEIAKSALMTGLEVAVEAYEKGVRPIAACLARGVRYAAYAFVDGMVSYALGKVLDAGFGKAGEVLGKTKVGSWVKSNRVGALVAKKVAGKLQDKISSGANELLKSGMDRITGGEYSQYLERKDAFGAEPGGIVGLLDAGATAFAKDANSKAQQRLYDSYNAHLMHKSITERGLPGGEKAGGWRDLKRAELAQKKGGLFQRDDAFQKHFGKGMTGFNKPFEFKATHHEAPSLSESAKVGGKTVLDKVKKQVVNDALETATKELFGQPQDRTAEKAQQTLSSSFARNFLNVK